MHNGNLSRPIIPLRGISKGDPLSPYLYILLANVLSRMISNLKIPQKWTRIRICSNARPLSHLLYANDSMFFFKAIKIVSTLSNGAYENSVTSQVNKSITQSALIFCPSVPYSMKMDMSSTMRIPSHQSWKLNTLEHG